MSQAVFVHHMQIPLKASQNSLISKFFSAKQPKTEERDKGTRSTDATIPAGPKEEPILEGYEGVVVSDSNDETKELDEEKEKLNEAQNLCFQKVVKAEPFIGDSSAIASHPESVKNEVEEDAYGEVESVETGGLELTGKSSGKSGTKRDYELFSDQEKPPWKQSVRSQDVDKSCGKHGRKQGKGKSNIKKSRETQSTLHFFFDEK